MTDPQEGQMPDRPRRVDYPTVSFDISYSLRSIREIELAHGVPITDVLADDFLLDAHQQAQFVYDHLLGPDKPSFEEWDEQVDGLEAIAAYQAWRNGFLVSLRHTVDANDFLASLQPRSSAQASQS